MATPRYASHLFNSLRCARQVQPRFVGPRCISMPTVRQYAVPAGSPPLIEKIQSELKPAMKAKDKERLSILRSILSHNLNASKSNQPIKNDVQAVALLRKLVYNARDSVSDLERAGRQEELAAERRQIQMLEDYIAGSGVPQLREAELRPLIQEAIDASIDKVKDNVAEEKRKAVLVGNIMKYLAPHLKGKDVDKNMLEEHIEDLLGGTA